MTTPTPRQVTASRRAGWLLLVGMLLIFWAGTSVGSSPVLGVAAIGIVGYLAISLAIGMMVNESQPKPPPAEEEKQS